MVLYLQEFDIDDQFAGFRVDEYMCAAQRGKIQGTRKNFLVTKASSPIVSALKGCRYACGVDTYARTWVWSVF